MMTDMYLISGFLGAGKTTLIQKLLTEAFKSKKVARFDPLQKVVYNQL